MNNYADAQRRAKEFNAQAPKDEIAELKRAVCVLAQGMSHLFVKDAYSSTVPGANQMNSCWDVQLQQLSEIIASLQPPPAGGRGE